MFRVRADSGLAGIGIASGIRFWISGGAGSMADGDEVILTGCCKRAGYRRTGFGACTGES